MLNLYIVTITEKYLTLPGNVLITIRPNEQDQQKQKTYSIPNIHGDIFATIDGSGALISTHSTGPFGENIANQTNPTNTVSGTNYAYVGQYQKLTETNFSLNLTQMGARVYLTSLGRFAQVDPVEGGTDNAYAYANDPVNDYDLDGTFIPFVVGALYVGGVAWSAWTAYKNPSPVNYALLGATVVPGVGAIASKSGKLGQLAVRVAGSKGGQGAGKGFSRSVLKQNDIKGKSCAYMCGRKATDGDHIIAKTRGGNNTIKNLQPTCRTCNASKGNRLFPKGITNIKKTQWFVKRMVRR